MNKVLIVADNDARRFSDKMTEVVNSKMVINIMYESLAVPNAYKDGVPIGFDIYDRAMVIYTE